MRKRFKTLEESQADQLAKAIRHREYVETNRCIRNKRLARNRVAREARQDVTIEARRDEIAKRVAKMRAAKIAWMMKGHATINLPNKLVKCVELD